MFNDVDPADLKPPPRFLEVAQEIAHKVKVDTNEVAQGKILVYKDIAFHLKHYGALDPNGVTLVVHIGDLPEGEGEFTCRQLLEMNATLPTAGASLYCVLPGTQTIGYSMRFDLEKIPNAADMMLAVVGATGDQIESLVKSMNDNAQKLYSELESGAFRHWPADEAATGEH